MVDGAAQSPAVRCPRYEFNNPPMFCVPTRLALCTEKKKFGGMNRGSSFIELADMMLGTDYQESLQDVEPG